MAERLRPSCRRPTVSFLPRRWKTEGEPATRAQRRLSARFPITASRPAWLIRKRWAKKKMLESNPSLIEQREAHYVRFLGPATEKVMHSTDIKPVHVDIYTFPPTEARPFYTLITGGMSDLRQSVPDNCDIAPRAEIMLYVSEPQGWMYNVLKGLAEMPSSDDTFLSYRHTVPNGKPMTAVPSALTSYFFVNPLMMPDSFSPMLVDGDPTDILHLIPITEEERHYAKVHGGSALISLFAERGLDPVVDEKRASLVSPDEI
ncbi:MAG: suppressor of fused domain protein [Opitutaceae bacterium]|nr:suppressor of fused domain protein [Opitutaceae bacterium]